MDVCTELARQRSGCFCRSNVHARIAPQWSRPIRKGAPDRLGRPCWSADRQAVLEAALGPQRVLTALDLQLRAFADGLLEDLAVVADVLDDPVSPVVRQVDGLAVLA